MAKPQIQPPVQILARPRGAIRMVIPLPATRGFSGKDPEGTAWVPPPTGLERHGPRNAADPTSFDKDEHGVA
jgi:hypothetical protein